MTDCNYWAVIPAAGVGTRMVSECPKQYLKICGKTIIEYALEQFLHCKYIRGVVVALTENDPYWSSLPIANHEKIFLIIGGRERYESVLNSLNYLLHRASSEDWVLVHDAARPCLGQADLDHLIKSVTHHPVGGVLATPVKDTMKRTDNTGVILETLDRNNLWRALTPQMFRLQFLLHAINAARKNDITVTDEAMAVEAYGYRPLVVEGDPYNIKITYEKDLALAEMYIKFIGKN